MRIGPLTYRPPITTMVGQMRGVLGSAGVIYGGKAMLPASMKAGGAIDYGTSGIFEPLVSVRDAASSAGIHYELAGGDLGSDSSFVAESEFVSSMFSMDASVISRVFSTDIALGLGVPDKEDAVERAQQFSGTTFADIIGTFMAGLDAEQLGSTRELMLELAEDANYAADLKWREGERICCRDAAVLSFLSGILLITGRSPSMGEVSSAFMHSSNHFEEAGMPVAAALVSEVALFVIKAMDQDLDPTLKTDRRVASRWLAVARKLDGVDPAGFAVSVYRGLTASFFGGDRCIDTLRVLLRSSARIHSSLGQHTLAASDYLRIAMGLLATFSGSPAEWRGLADSLRMAIGEYRREGGMDEMIANLDDLEDLARRVSGNYGEELTELDELITEVPDDVGALAQRGVISLKYGNFRGALADLKLANMLAGGDAEIEGEIGHLHHMQSDFLRRTGNVAEADILWSMAMDSISRALNAMGEEEPEEGETLKLLMRARLGALLASGGRFEEAIDQLTAIHEICPDDREVDRYLKEVERQAESERENKKVVPFRAI